MKRCRSTTQNTKTKKTKVDVQVTSTIFRGLCAYIHPAGLGKTRLKLFRTQFLKHGGDLSESIQTDTNYVLIEDSVKLNTVLKSLGISQKQKSVKFVTISWLSCCLKEKKLLNYAEFELPEENMESDVKREGGSSTEGLVNDISKPSHSAKTGIRWHNQTTSKNDSESDYDSDTTADSGFVSTPNVSPVKTSSSSYVENMKTKFACAHSSSEPQENLNQHITDELQKLAVTYQNSNDRWRALGYQKALTVIKNHPKKITTYEEARSLRGIGSRLADKIWEIIESGKLRKVEEVCNSEKTRTINLFSQVWGAGPTTAEMWYQQGLRTLDDVRQRGKLTKQQEVGLRLYEDLQERMSYSEAGQIEAMVCHTALSLVPGLHVEACGSYRRGKATCGDVDVLVTHPDGRSHRGVFRSLIEELHRTGFLTDDLVQQECSGNQQKYLGICKLPGENSKHRRLDIIVVPYSEYACAVLYFTGSAHFNRSMRLLASKMGMSLSEHALRAGVIRRGREKINDGYILETPTEESVFKHLGIPYRSPSERDH